MRLKKYKGVFKLKKLGSSVGVIFKKEVRNILNIYENDCVGIKIWKIVEIKITCPKCKKDFFDYKEAIIYDCPYCGIEIVKGGYKKEKMSEENEEIEETKDEEVENEESIEEPEEEETEEESEDGEVDKE